MIRRRRGLRQGIRRPGYGGRPCVGPLLGTIRLLSSNPVGGRKRLHQRSLGPWITRTPRCMWPVQVRYKASERVDRGSALPSLRGSGRGCRGRKNAASPCASSSQRGVHDLVAGSNSTLNASTNSWTGSTRLRTRLRIGGRVHGFVNGSSLTLNASTSWWTRRRIREPAENDSGRVHELVNASTDSWTG